jgi:hypothetical protein
LCGDIDNLLFKLGNSLDTLKYSVDIRRLSDLRKELQLIGNLDSAIYASYDEFAKQLDDLSTELRTALPVEAVARRDYVRHVIDDFEEDLFATLASVRAAKDRILH